MSETTKIEWATSTGNPWIGCTKVSPGCKNCYAETLDRQRFSRTLGGGTKEKPVSHWGPGAPRVRTKGFWKDAQRWNQQPFICDGCGMAHENSGRICMTPGCDCETRHPPRIFPSLCDWLDDEVPTEWLADFLKLIHDTPYLDWLLLTKRPELFEERLIEAYMRYQAAYAKWVDQWRTGEVIQPNVWIGTSVEDQQRADERIPALLKIPAKVRFLSVEPMLGPVDLDCAFDVCRDPQHGIGPGDNHACPKTGFSVNWVIVGGESGAGARPCNVEWVRHIVAQCKAAGVPCFVKQLGSNPFFEHTNLNLLKHPKGGDPSEWPEDCRVRAFPKLASGSLL